MSRDKVLRVVCIVAIVTAVGVGAFYAGTRLGATQALDNKPATTSAGAATSNAATTSTAQTTAGAATDQASKTEGARGTTSASSNSDITGYLIAVNTKYAEEPDGFYVMSTSVDGNTISFDAQFGYSETTAEYADISKILPRDTYTFTLADDCSYTGSGGDPGYPTPYPSEELFINTLVSNNGLSLTVHVVNGVIQSMDLCS